MVRISNKTNGDQQIQSGIKSLFFSNRLRQERCIIKHDQKNEKNRINDYHRIIFWNDIHKLQFQIGVGGR